MFKRIFVLAVIGLFLGFSAAFAATLELPRTGQTSCYDSTGATVTCSGTGQDGEYQLGVAWPNPGSRPFPFEADCVTDNLTGLVWVTSLEHNSRPGRGPWIMQITLFGAVSDWRLPNVNEL